LNFQVNTFSYVTNYITLAPYGFVDASTLSSWIDDAFSLYNPNSWSLYQTPLDFTKLIPTVIGFNVTDATILAYGN